MTPQVRNVLTKVIFTRRFTKQNADFILNNRIKFNFNFRVSLIHKLHQLLFPFFDLPCTGIFFSKRLLFKVISYLIVCRQ